jgi:hypothetical protein
MLANVASRRWRAASEAIRQELEAERFRSGEVSEIISGHRERETVMKLGYKQYLVAGALVGALTPYERSRAEARRTRDWRATHARFQQQDSREGWKDGDSGSPAQRQGTKEGKKNCLDTKRPFHERQVDDS